MELSPKTPSSSAESTDSVRAAPDVRPPGIPHRDDKSAVFASFQDTSRVPLVPAQTYAVPEGAELVAEDIAGCEIYVCREMTSVARVWAGLEETAEMTPFQRFAWLNGWLKRLPATARIEPLVALVFERGVIRLIAPLGVEAGIVADRLVWLAQDINDYNAPLVDRDWLARLRPETAREIWHRILHCDHGADYVHLTHQPAYLGHFRNPFLGDEPAPFSCDSHFLTLSSNWQQLYAGLRSAKSRRRLREKMKKLEKSGPIRFRRIRRRVEIESTLATLLSWKQEQLERRGSRNPFADGLIGAQLLALATDPRTNAMARVYCLEVDGRPMAATVALVQSGVFNFYVSAYSDAGHRNSSPGTIMLVKLIELAARAGCAKFDFSMGDEAYKAEWCNGRLLITHQTQALTILGLPCAMLARLAIAVKRGIKANDLLLNALQTVNARRIAWVRGRGVGARA